MADLVINNKTYTGVQKVKFPSTNGQMARFKFDRYVPSSDSITILDYLDTSGNGCVDLGIKFNYPTGNYKQYFKFKVNDAATTQVLFSSAYGGSNNSVDQLAIVSSKLALHRITTNQSHVAVAVGDIIEYSEVNRTITVVKEATSTNTYTANASMVDITPNNNFVLFGEPKNGVYATFANLRFYEFYYQEGGEDIIHLLPAIDGNGIKCLWDSVSNELFYSDNGAFETE